MKREEILKNLIKSGMKVLDVGCGSGRVLRELVRKTGCFGVGIDPFVTNFEGRDYRLIRMKAEEVDRLGEIFDLVYSIHSFHHLENPERFLKNLHEVLSPKGKLIIFDWKKGAYTGIPEEYYSQDELKSLLEASGYMTLEAHEDSMELFIIAKRRSDMRIAVATDDGKTVRFGHFGDAEMYYIFDYEDGVFKFVEKRINEYTDEKLGIEEHNNPEKAKLIKNLLSDCQVFVGHSMGLQNRKLLEKRGIKMIPLYKKGVSIEDALKKVMDEIEGA